MSEWERLYEETRIREDKLEIEIADLKKENEIFYNSIRLIRNEVYNEGITDIKEVKRIIDDLLSHCKDIKGD